MGTEFVRVLRYGAPMIRFLVNTAVYFLAAAIGLFVADMVLDAPDFSITYPTGFVTAALIFGLIQAILTPLFAQLTERHATMLAGGVGLISAFVALVITAAISDALTISGFTTWFIAALIIWLASMVASFILKVTVAKKVIREVRD
jgi:putative membrane protein